MVPMGELLRNEGKLQACELAGHQQEDPVQGFFLLKRIFFFLLRLNETCLLGAQPLKAPLLRCKVRFGLRKTSLHPAGTPTTLTPL